MEFQRLGLVTLYQKAAGEPGWFGPTMGHAEDEDGLGQILSYNQDVERVLVAKTVGRREPTYYYCFRDGLPGWRGAGPAARRKGSRRAGRWRS